MWYIACSECHHSGLPSTLHTSDILKRKYINTRTPEVDLLDLQYCHSTAEEADDGEQEEHGYPSTKDTLG